MCWRLFCFLFFCFICFFVDGEKRLKLTRSEVCANDKWFLCGISVMTLRSIIQRWPLTRIRCCCDRQHLKKNLLFTLELLLFCTLGLPAIVRCCNNRHLTVYNNNIHQTICTPIQTIWFTIIISLIITITFINSNSSSNHSNNNNNSSSTFNFSNIRINRTAVPRFCPWTCTYLRDIRSTRRPIAATTTTTTAAGRPCHIYRLQQP